VTTYGPLRAPARALAVAIALSVGGVGPLSRAPSAEAAPPPDRIAPPVVFFWSGPGRALGETRQLLGAVQSAAAAVGARVLDLSPPVAIPPDTAARVARAVTAYDAMRFADAIAALDSAALAAAEHGGWGLSREALVDLFLYRALARTESGDEAAAWSDFVRAATIDPSRVLDPARFRPSAVKSFGRAVREVAARQPVTLTVRAPPGSRIHIDGRASGAEQASESLLPGEHYVWIERPEAAPFGRTVTLATAASLVAPDGAAARPDDAQLRRRAQRLSAGTPLVVALSRQGGIDTVELRSLDPGGAVPRGAVRLGPSPEANASDLRQVVGRALGELAAAARGRAELTSSSPGATGERRWYQSRWLWLGVGAAAALVAVSPFLLDSSGSPRTIPAAVDLGSLE
jgi:hypothetical protein